MNKKGLILGITTTLMLGACGAVEIIKATETEPQYSAIILEEQKPEIESAVEDEPKKEIVTNELEEIEIIEPVVVEPIENESCKALRVYNTTDKWELFRLLSEDKSYDWQPFLEQEFRKFWLMVYNGHFSATKDDYSFESFWNKHSDSLESWQLHCIYEIHIAPLLEGC